MKTNEPMNLDDVEMSKSPLRLDDFVKEIETRAQAFREMAKFMPDEKMRIASRSGAEAYDAVLRMAYRVQLDQVELIGILIDAAGGTIEVGKEHMLRAKEGGVVSVRDPDKDVVRYQRQFELKPVGEIQ